MFILLFSLKEEALAYYLYTEKLSQSDFRSLVEDIGTLIGKGGGRFDVENFRVEFRTIFLDIGRFDPQWVNVSENGTFPELLPFLEMDITKRIYRNFGGGLSFISLPHSQFQVITLWSEYEIIKDSVISPSVSIRTFYARTIQNTSPHFYSIGAEGGITKRKAGIVYFGGVGVYYVKGNSRELAGEDVFRVKLKAGVELIVSPAVLSAGLEISTLFMYSIGFGFSF